MFQLFNYVTYIQRRKSFQLLTVLLIVLAAQYEVSAVHKKYIIHVPFKVHHEHHTKTIYKPVHHTEHGHGHKGDYEVLGYSKSDPYDNLLEGTHIYYSQPTHEYELEGGIGGGGGDGGGDDGGGYDGGAEDEHYSVQTQQEEPSYAESVQAPHQAYGYNNYYHH